jgi:hypothetical protein
MLTELQKDQIIDRVPLDEESLDEWNDWLTTLDKTTRTEAETFAGEVMFLFGDKSETPTPEE